MVSKGQAERQGPYASCSHIIFQPILGYDDLVKFARFKEIEDDSRPELEKK